MRITGGKYKGRRIQCPRGIIRPAMDRMRESVFSILGNLEGLSFLDLFSGSGLMALEAASRGVEKAHAVENDRRKREVLTRNLSIADGTCTMSMSSVEAFMARHQENFDIVFLDPPFPYKQKNDILQALVNSQLLHAGTEVCLHFPSEDLISNQFVRRDGMLMMVCRKEKKYGRSLVNFYRVQQGATL